MVKSRLRANLEDGLRNYKSVSEKPVLANIVSSKNSIRFISPGGRLAPHRTHPRRIIYTLAHFIGPRRSRLAQSELRGELWPDPREQAGSGPYPALPGCRLPVFSPTQELEDDPGALPWGCWSPVCSAGSSLLCESSAHPVWRQPPTPLTGAARRAPGAVPGAAGRARPAAHSFRARISEEREAGRGLGEYSGLQPPSSELETLQAQRPGFGDSASPPRQVQEEEAAPEYRGPRAAAAASFPGAGLKPLGAPGFCCCARRRRRHHHAQPVLLLAGAFGARGYQQSGAGVNAAPPDP
ncbi:PREDICTED: uncharacterized protein LOC109390150 [Hipposideros armiger]|uniref:Uncharacterized protein LOC109390150 n=1 Tax=Hipposideros armiger TaxID=186990 RepID=A0A8B7SER3_HIPAR|nr:PREDICTED: uncharacterized protein LOC109390150 [Hipposideros armiger]